MIQAAPRFWSQPEPFPPQSPTRLSGPFTRASSLPERVEFLKAAPVAVAKRFPPTTTDSVCILLIALSQNDGRGARLHHAPAHGSSAPFLPMPYEKSAPTDSTRAGPLEA